jgi:predicted ATPase with chaperone activity
VGILKRALKIAAAGGAALLYLWFAGVRNAALAKRRRAGKAARRRARRE